MLIRAVLLLVILLMPLEARAAGYVVRPGDTLTSIAQRYGVSVATLAHLNHLGNINLIELGRVLLIPDHTQLNTFAYQVRWGDTLFGLAARYHITLATIRRLNPTLGEYPLAGQWLKLCDACSSSSAGVAATTPSPSTPSQQFGTLYQIQPGDTLSSIATRYGVSTATLVSTNQLTNPNRILIGTRLSIPRAWATAYDPWQARALIVSYARQYGLYPALPLAIGWQESGFNQNMISRTGAVGVMQVEPYTGDHIAFLLGRSFNLYNIDDNIHAGVYWLATLLNYYSGNERLAVAAYYEGTRNIARYGFFQDTVQYVADVEALKSNFGG